jgi:hypothetical protein
MNCYLCKKETTEFGTMYAEKVCIECTDKHLEAQKLREDFMKQYKIEHAACPNCGDLRHTTTLVSYIYHSNRPDEYKNLNNCVCSHCGNKHTTHDRIKKLT